MTPAYNVLIVELGFSVSKLDDNIASARRWAKSAFPKLTTIVSRETDRPICECCGSRPCAYGRRRKSS